MPRATRLRPLGRGLLAAVLATGVAAIAPPAATAADSAEAVIAPAFTSAQFEHVYAAGTTGFLRSNATGDGYVWTSYDGSPDRPVPALQGVDPSRIKNTESDLVVHLVEAAGQEIKHIEFVDPIAGTTRTVTLTDDQSFNGVAGDTVVAFQEHGDTGDDILLIGPGPDGTQQTRTVQGFPAGARVWQAGTDGDAVGDARGAAFYVLLPDGSANGYVDFATARFTAFGAGGPGGIPKIRVSGDRILWDDGATFHTALRDDPSRAVVNMAVPSGAGHVPYIGGDQILAAVNGTLRAYDPETGAARTVLRNTVGDVVTGGAVQGPDGYTLSVGDDSGAVGPAVFRVGATTATSVLARPVRPSRTTSLAMYRGQLVTRDVSGWGSVGGGPYSVDLAATGAPAATGTRGALAVASSTTVHDSVRFVPLGDGKTAAYASDRTLWFAGARTGSYNPGLGAMQVVGASTRYVAYRAGTGSAARLGVYDPAAGKSVYQRADAVAALWNSSLWTVGSGGSLVATDPATGKTSRTVAAGIGCAVTGLQVVDDWAYWSCGTASAGVIRLSTGTKTALPARESVLADGFVARLDVSGALTVVDVRSGSAVAKAVAKPATAAAGDGWTADPVTNTVAWVDADGAVHTLRSGIPTSALHLTDQAEPAVADAKSTDGWVGSWGLSKPAASWTLTFTSAVNGKTGQTMVGGAARDRIRGTWDGIDYSGTWAANGPYNWTLTVKPADGAGAPLVRKGTVRLTGGAASYHDGSGPDGLPDGVGDLLTQTADGWLTWQLGNGKGGVSGKTGGKGWATGTLAVPFGDMGADRCNDVLIRLASGELLRYAPACGKAVSPTTSHTSLGTGWNQYKTLLTAGPRAPEARSDLLAWQTSTGDVYRYDNLGNGKLGPRVRIITGWKYLKLIGVGDINGDGIGDLLALDHGYTLWGYYGNGQGGFGARHQIWTDWGKGYNVITGVGDITGDGKVDIVERDSAGTVWRNAGNGNGGFGGRAQVVTGWKGYSAIY